jgi:PAS domain S-box-containing protein
VWAAEPAPIFIEATKDTTFPPGVGLPGRVWATRRPAWIQNVVDDPNFPRAPIARKEGLHGAFAFPIELGDQFFGVIEFFNRSVAAPDEDLLATMAALGTDVGRFVDQKRTEASAARTQHGTRAILETAPDAIISMDERGIITEFNPAAERMFGHRREDAVGRELAEIVIPAPLRGAHRSGLQRYLRTGVGKFIGNRVETTAVRANGEEFPAEIAITRVPTDPPIFTGFVRDITERTRAEHERRLLLNRELTARREAEAANRAKDEFLATLSHELRTPLNAITGWTRMLLDGSLDEATAHRALEVIDRNAQTQTQLVGDILDVSRIITGKLTLDVQPVDIATIVGSVLDGIRPAAAAKNIRLRSRLSPTARLTRGDPQRLQQVIWNLVSNALKFTPQNGRIDVEVADGGAATIEISITDTGVGIAPEFLDRVFDRFSQADSSSTRQHGGLGLGLAIVRHLVELHGGSVRAESAGVNKGARFTIALPKIHEDQLPGDVMPSAAADHQGSGTAVLAGCDVLVVEDERDARELLRTLLTGAGAAVRVTASAAQAIDEIDARRPDVLVSDIGLVGEDGYTLIRKVRSRESENGRLPAVAITAYARRDDRERAIEAGFDRYLAKPIQPQVVIDVVSGLWKE